MSTPADSRREGSLEAPQRSPLDWKSPEFYDEARLFDEMSRVFEICHGCRRCFSLCNAFPTLFDAIDDSPAMDLEGVERRVYWRVVDNCYLCDMCFMTKCPYVPPHPWNVDFPKLMLRGKAIRFKSGAVTGRDRVISSTNLVGKLATIPVVSQAVNAAQKSRSVRKLIERTAGIHADAWLPPYRSDILRRRVRGRLSPALEPRPGTTTRGRVVLFPTCYGHYNEPQLGEDLMAVMEHNGVPVDLTQRQACCGMPKLEIGDLDTVARLKGDSVPELARWVDQGFDILAPVPSCVLMFKQEFPLLFPDDPEVGRVSRATFDPFEYLMLRHRDGLLKTDFKHPLGKVLYHAACHLRVQNVGLKTRELLALIPDTQVEVVERCSGHDGTYAVKREFHDFAMKIGRPVFDRVAKSQPDHYTSDCPIAGHQIENGLDDGSRPTHPLTLLRMAYGL
jgi:glycerol-3-phosphate dehydrogenase subunit C